MKRTGVVTDSHSSIKPAEAAKLEVLLLPMPFYLDECYYEDVTITREEFFEKVRGGAKVSTSQPTPDAVCKLWDQALEQFEEIVYIPLSSALSGACGTAMMLAQEEPYAGKVFVVDNGRVSSTQKRTVLDALELIEEGYSAGKIKKMLEAARERSKTSAALGSLMNIRPVLKFSTGILETYKKCHGFHRAKKEMIDAMKNEFATNFKEEIEKGEVYLLAASSASKEASDEWVKEIQEAFPGMDVVCDELSLGVSCHIGPGGLGIGCSCKPRRI